MERGICSVVGCGKPHKSATYCATHYARYRRGADVSTAIRNRVAVKPESCSEDGCDLPVKAVGLCSTHYARYLRHGHTRYRDRKKPAKMCRVPECDNFLYAKGICHAHYIKQRKWKVYGLSLDGYLAMVSEQNGVCKICLRPERHPDKASGKIRDMAVDHCHETHRVRGLLCSACNTAIGLLQDDPEVLRRAASYLERP